MKTFYRIIIERRPKTHTHVALVQISTFDTLRNVRGPWTLHAQTEPERTKSAARWAAQIIIDTIKLGLARKGLPKRRSASPGMTNQTHTPEARAKIAAAMRASWARRIAAGQQPAEWLAPYRFKPTPRPGADARIRARTPETHLAPGRESSPTKD